MKATDLMLGSYWIRLDSGLFPQVKWEDEEPTKAEITITL